MLYELFGGSITANFPTTFLDTSTIRQIPDSQEVFLSTTIPNLSLILEVCESVEPVDHLTALEFHFHSLAEDNSSTSTSISSTSYLSTSLPPPPFNDNDSPSLISPPVILKGYQTIAKFNKPIEESEKVVIYMGLWRIDSKKVDLVLCVNYPLPPFSSSSSSTTTITAEEAEAENIFKEAMQTLIVKDFNLFR